MPHERRKQKNIRQLRFKPEGYVSPGDTEFLDELLDTLKASGFDPEGLVFSGFDGTEAAKGQPMPKYSYIFAMNEAGWKAAVKDHEENPAEYAEGWDTPCIGLYDRGQLTHVYSSNIDQKDLDERVELTNIKLGDNLADLPPETPVQEAVVHKDYPNASPSDALVGVVFLER